jgi:beta-galactosidase GanA
MSVVATDRQRKTKKKGKEMKKMMMAVAGLAMATVLTGCGGSPKGVAEKFANAVIQRDTEKAVDLSVVSVVGSESDIKKAKEKIEALGKEINDPKLEAESMREVISVPSEDSGYKIVNGAKVTRDEAEVIVQFVKGKDKKGEGMEIDLGKVDGTWKVVNFKSKSGLDK